MKSFAIVLAACGCSDPSAKPDAAVDAPKMIDAKGVDAGMCGTDTLFTGEHLDWDSTDATFCGVFNATWKVQGSTDPKESHTTPPNGRLVMCVPGAASNLDVTVPTGTSPCLGMTSGYTINGLAHVEPAILAMLPATEVFRARSFTTARQATFYSQIGVAYDPTKGGLLVHVAGTPHTVSIDAAHATTMAYDGSTMWAAGSTGQDVYFPNVTPGTATITATGAMGAGPVTVVANTITYATIYSP